MPVMNSAIQKDSRALLIAAAVELMTQRNSVDFSLNDVATHSGLNSALVRYYFGNKRGLLLAVVERIASQSLRQFEELLAMDLPPESKLRLHISGVTRTYLRYPYYNRLIHNLLDQPDPEVSRLFVGPLLEAQTRLLEEGYAAGVFRKTDPVLFYMSVIGACDSLFYTSRTLPQEIRIEKVTDELRDRYTKFVADMVVGSLLIPVA